MFKDVLHDMRVYIPLPCWHTKWKQGKQTGVGRRHRNREEEMRESIDR